MPVACLPLLAALTPPEHPVTLIDENVEPIDFDRIARADIVGLTGMSVQRRRMREILAELKRRGALRRGRRPLGHRAGGLLRRPGAIVFVGEAEETWPQFLEDWQRGDARAPLRAGRETDMTTVPTPRFDLLKMRHYLFGSLQFSRGCPFQCEFCDIIVTFGRRPRLKTAAQIIAELDALRAQRMEIVFIVDDNLIGNKKAIKELLRGADGLAGGARLPADLLHRGVARPGRGRGADAPDGRGQHPQRLRRHREPQRGVARETKKYQNVRTGGTILEQVTPIQDAGLEVWCGMILGFDNDDATIFSSPARVPARGADRPRDGRHALRDPQDAAARPAGRRGPARSRRRLAVRHQRHPRRLTREELRDGYVRVMDDLYEPEAYFERLVEGTGQCGARVRAGPGPLLAASPAGPR